MGLQRVGHHCVSDFHSQRELTVLAQWLEPGGNGLLAFKMFPRLHCPKMHEVPECFLMYHAGASRLGFGARRQEGRCSSRLLYSVLCGLRCYPTCQLVCQGSTDVGRRRVIPASVTKGFTTPGAASCLSSEFVSTSLALALTGRCERPRWHVYQLQGLSQKQKGIFSAV